MEVVLSDVFPPETYVFRLLADGVEVRIHFLCDACECVRSWKANVLYLRNVVENAQEYIDNPAKLDWQWIYDV